MDRLEVIDQLNTIQSEIKMESKKTLQEEIDAIITKMIIETLQHTGGNVAQAAKILGCTKNTIYNNYSKYSEIRASVKLLGKAGNPRIKKV